MIRSIPLRRGLLVIVTCLLVTAAAGCGTDETDPTAQPTSVGADNPDSTASTDPSTTTTSTTTTPGSTTPSPTAMQATTTVPKAVRTGWAAVDAMAARSEAFPPCCADTWHGDPSPPLTPADQPLADSSYAIAMKWSDDPTEPLLLDVFRFEHCGLLPQSACEQPGLGNEFAADALGIDTSASRQLSVPLDGDVRAVVVGWGEVASERFVIEEATGAELADLAVEVDQADADVFADRFAAGADEKAIVADVLANPAGGLRAGTGVDRRCLLHADERTAVAVPGGLPIRRRTTDGRSRYRRPHDPIDRGGRRSHHRVGVQRLLPVMESALVFDGESSTGPSHQSVCANVCVDAPRASTAASDLRCCRARAVGLWPRAPSSVILVCESSHRVVVPPTYGQEVSRELQGASA